MVTYTKYSNVSETVSLIFNSASIENIRVYVSIYVPEYIHRHLDFLSISRLISHLSKNSTPSICKYTVYLHIAGVEFFEI